MKISLCADCYLDGYCRRARSRVVTKNELTPEFVRQVRAFMRNLDIGCDAWANYVTDLYRDFPGRIVDASGREVHLDTEVFDAAGIRYWFRDLCRELPPSVSPRIRREAVARFIVLASILRATNASAFSSDFHITEPSALVAQPQKSLTFGSIENNRGTNT